MAGAEHFGAAEERLLTRVGLSGPEPGDNEVEICQRSPSCVDQSETMQNGDGQSLDVNNSGCSDKEPANLELNATQQAETRPRRYTARKRQSPRLLGWEDWLTKRGRLAALDFLQF